MTAADRFAHPVKPVPSVYVDGELMATTAAAVPLAATATPVVLDDLQTTWGRQRLLDNAESQQARFSVIDQRGKWSGRDLIGSAVTFVYTDGATSRTFFRGRIAEQRMIPREPYPSTFMAGRWRGAFHEFTCTGQLTELGNRTTGIESWPDESGLARMNRLRAIAAPVVPTVGYRAYWEGAPVAARNVDNVDVLSLLKSMFDTAGSDRMIYDPNANAIKFQQRRVVTSTRRTGLGINSVVAGDPGVNVFALANTGEGTLSLDAGEFDVAGGALTKALESRLTRVDYSWTSGGAQSGGVVLDSNAEATKGRRGLNLTTELRQGDWAVITASDWYQLVTREGSAFAPPPMTYRGDLLGGFRSSEHARLLIGATESAPGESGRILAVTNSPWPRLAVPPVFGIIGGTVRYIDGAWMPTIVLQPCDYQGLAANDLTGSRLRLTGGTAFQWRQFSKSLTWNDLRYAGSNGGF